MNHLTTTRIAVRFISFGLAMILAFSVATIQYRHRSTLAEKTLEQYSSQTINALNHHLNELNIILQKLHYSTDVAALFTFCMTLWHESSMAKVKLQQLSSQTFNLPNTTEFLSKINHFSDTLLRQLSMNQPLSVLQQNTLQTLQSYTHLLLEEMLNFQDIMYFNPIVDPSLSTTTIHTDPTVIPVFSPISWSQQLDEQFSLGNMPELANLLLPDPTSSSTINTPTSILDTAPHISSDLAIEIAQSIANTTMLTPLPDQPNSLPSYTFSNDKIHLSITKQGGYLSFLLKQHTVSSTILSLDEAKKQALAFLEKQGLMLFQDTQHQLKNGIATIEFAPIQQHIVLYPDIITISVAMDTGEIILFDSTNYLKNHHIRTAKKPLLTPEQASEKLHSSLNINKTTLCVISLNSTTEQFCYEFLCVTPSKQELLIYLDADTGIQHQLFLLNRDETGQVTR